MKIVHLVSPLTPRNLLRGRLRGQFTWAGLLRSRRVVHAAAPCVVPLASYFRLLFYSCSVGSARQRPSASPSNYQRDSEQRSGRDAGDDQRLRLWGFGGELRTTADRDKRQRSIRELERHADRGTSAVVE